MTHRKSYTISDFYQFYLSNIERDTVYDIDYKVYRQIIEDYLNLQQIRLLNIVENLNYHADQVI